MNVGSELLLETFYTHCFEKRPKSENNTGSMSNRLSEKISKI